jgi:hypothetical protein
VAVGKVSREIENSLDQFNTICIVLNPTKQVITKATTRIQTI